MLRHTARAKVGLRAGRGAAPFGSQASVERALAYVNSHFQTGLKSVLDRAILAHEESHAHARVPLLTKVDEIPFDFERRRLSVVVENSSVSCKTMPICARNDCFVISRTS